MFNELFDSDGCDIVLRPADHYVSKDSVSVAQLRAAGLERNETVLGYRIAATREIVVNPPRATELTFGAGDEVLVLTRAIARASRGLTQSAVSTGTRDRAPDSTPARAAGLATTS